MWLSSSIWETGNKHSLDLHDDEKVKFLIDSSGNWEKEGQGQEQNKQIDANNVKNISTCFTEIYKYIYTIGVKYLADLEKLFLILKVLFLMKEVKHHNFFYYTKFSLPAPN